MPHSFRHVFESLLEALGLILRLDAYGRDILYLADENDLDPLGEFAISATEKKSVKNSGYGLRIMKAYENSHLAV